MKIKSQIKFGETIGIIFIVYILILMILVWYSSYNTKKINSEKLEFIKKAEMNRFYYILNTPLLKDSLSSNIKGFGLVPILTFSKFAKTDEGRFFLVEQLGFSTITLKLYNETTIPNINNKNYFKKILLYNVTPPKDSRIISVENFKTLIPVINESNSKIMVGLINVKNYVVMR